MQKSAVVSHFGTQQKLAEALGITQGTISGWKDPIPMARALQIEKITRGKLKADLSLYAQKRTRT